MEVFMDWGESIFQPKMLKTVTEKHFQTLWMGEVTLRTTPTLWTGTQCSPNILDPSCQVGFGQQQPKF